MTARWKALCVSFLALVAAYGLPWASSTAVGGVTEEAVMDTGAGADEATMDALIRVNQVDPIGDVIDVDVLGFPMESPDVQGDVEHEHGGATAPSNMKKRPVPSWLGHSTEPYIALNDTRLAHIVPYLSRNTTCYCASISNFRPNSNLTSNFSTNFPGGITPGAADLGNTTTQVPTPPSLSDGRPGVGNPLPANPGQVRLPTEFICDGWWTLRIGDRHFDVRLQHGRLTVNGRRGTAPTQLYRRGTNVWALLRDNGDLILDIERAADGGLRVTDTLGQTLHVQLSELPRGYNEMSELLDEVAQ